MSWCRWVRVQRYMDALKRWMLSVSSFRALVTKARELFKNDCEMGVMLGGGGSMGAIRHKPLTVLLWIHSNVEKGERNTMRWGTR